MKETDLQPYDLTGKKMFSPPDDCTLADLMDYQNQFTYYYSPELPFGCPICNSPLIATRKPICSNSNCPGWVVHRNGEVFYQNRRIFHAEWKFHKEQEEIIVVFLSTPYGSDLDKITSFFRKLFMRIIKDKLVSNIYARRKFMIYQRSEYAPQEE